MVVPGTTGEVTSTPITAVNINSNLPFHEKFFERDEIWLDTLLRAFRGNTWVNHLLLYHEMVQAGQNVVGCTGQGQGDQPHFVVVVRENVFFTGLPRRCGRNTKVMTAIPSPWNHTDDFQTDPSDWKARCGCKQFCVALEFPRLGRASLRTTGVIDEGSSSTVAVTFPPWYFVAPCRDPPLKLRKQKRRRARDQVDTQPRRAAVP